MIEKHKKVCRLVILFHIGCRPSNLPVTDSIPFSWDVDTDATYRKPSISIHLHEEDATISEKSVPFPFALSSLPSASCPVLWPFLPSLQLSSSSRHLSNTQSTFISNSTVNADHTFAHRSSSSGGCRSSLPSYFLRYATSAFSLPFGPCTFWRSDI